MQSIYEFGGETMIDWDAVADGADHRVALEEPQRWTNAPELGQWTLAAREALRAGQCLPLDAAPECVQVIRVPDLNDVPNPRSNRVMPAIIPALGERLRALEGSTIVLTRSNAHVRGLYSAVRGSIVVQEGVDFAEAYSAFAAAEAAVGDPRVLAQAVVDLLAATCRGLDGTVRGQLTASLRPDRLNRGNRRRIGHVLDALEPLYASPDLATWCGGIARILRHPPNWLKVDLPASLQILARLHPHEEETFREALDAAVLHSRDAALIPRRAASTIHKAKGLEFDHVIVAHCSASPFPDDLEARRLMYVALSRACRSVTFLVSGRAPSPLLPLTNLTSCERTRRGHRR
jgi:DNA helicase-2/ATP-dependent DNA helicase PcrA